MATRTTSRSAARAARRGFARIGCTGGVLALLMASGTALAQGNGAFSNAPPNVLLLVDTSGSMERMPNGALPVCTPGVAGQEPNRWGQLVQGLTGSIQPFYSCGRMMRDGTPAAGSDQTRQSFLDAYWHNSLLGATSAEAKYDDGYHLPHHRPVSGDAGDTDGTCTYFPDHRDGALPVFGSATYDPDRIATYPWSSGTYSFSNGDADKCTFLQGDDGQLDAAGTFARFGLMTFDSDPSPGTGRFLGGLLPATTPANLNVGGQWSFLYSNSTPVQQLVGVSSTLNDPRFPLTGLIPGCVTPINMAVGARNEYAPPWEGPMIRFPDPNSTNEQLRTHNDGIQKAILAARPYGGTPTAGMMASAYDYLLRRPDGPRSDPYVTGGCRDQFVILLTDGGPNLDLRNLGSAASCGNSDEGTTPLGANPYCPFYLPSRTAARLRTDVTGSMKPIETFVVGFSVGGDSPPTAAANDGFPGAVASRTCSEWAQLAGTSTALHTQCVNQGPGLTPPGPPFGSTARACCELNDIALKGDPAGTRGAFFAENQSDLANVFAGILGRIARGASTRAVPAYSSPVTYTVAGPQTVTQSSTVVASFNADPASTSTNQTSSANIWAGNLTRQRSVCKAGATVEQPVANTVGSGDDFELEMQDNVTSGSPTKQRYFFTAIPTQVGGAVDGDETLRPYLPSDPDGVTAYGAAETVLTRDSIADATTFRNALNGASKKDVEDMFNVKKDSCREVSVKGKKKKLPKQESVDCARVVWGFATAARPADFAASEADYAVRCPFGSGAGQSTNPADCKPLGAIIHSSPTIVSAPSSLLRDEGYRKFVELFKDRRQTLYTATTDGLLHAFDVNYPLNAANNGIELWAFLPPAAIGQLYSNYPGGQRTLLDGTPVVKDVVFKRTKTEVGSDAPWHTALVAGLGKDGYFALDVTADGQIPNVGAYQRVTNGNLATLQSVLRPAPPNKPVGPHFLWQISSTQSNNGGDKGKKKGHKNKKGDELYAIFGDKTGTPAITTVLIGTTEVGVAILPGGIDESPPSGPSCPRRTSPLYNFPIAKDQVMNPRATVRGWASNCNETVAGRSVTIVRLDTGEIIKHFARNLGGDKDVPKRMIDKGVVINSPFDAPITGTPVVFPADVGSIAQKAFVGDADGTLYRLDLSDPNPNNWRAELFLDTRGTAFSSADFVGDKPIVVPPVVSLSETGNLVIGVANGDQEDFGTKPANDSNMLWSVTEIPSTVAGQPSRPSLNWYMKLTNGERVTGPMAVFDKTFYFSTYKVGLAGTACTVGSANLYGRDYVTPENSGNLALGGAFRSPAASPYTVVGPELIPGVSIRASQACAVDQPSNDYFGGTRIGAKLTTPTSYSLVANIAASSGAPGLPVKQISKPLALPRTRTVVDAWASIVE
ncbi:MAG TPA: PilC/PilY family type IV pilus protein [Polyangiaceae bacterium]|nr:PilC/PilY family type IV pilus protein [Polyangiaceae bacterium]